MFEVLEAESRVAAIMTPTMNLSIYQPLVMTSYIISVSRQIRDNHS